MWIVAMWYILMSTSILMTLLYMHVHQILLTTRPLQNISLLTKIMLFNGVRVSFNVYKTKFVSFHHHHSNPGFHPIDNSTLCEAISFDKLLSLKFTSELKWNVHISSITKEAGKMVGNLFHLRKSLTLFF